MSFANQQALNEAHRLIASDKEEMMKREFGGKNWPFHFRKEEFKRNSWNNFLDYPNLKEIDAYEFAQHPCISGSYQSELLSSVNVQYADPKGIPFARYARVLFQNYNWKAGYGVAFVAVPENPEDWNKSQNFASEVKHKLRHWSFCLCEHDFKQVGYRNCVTTYACSECDFHFEIDSSG